MVYSRNSKTKSYRKSFGAQSRKKWCFHSDLGFSVIIVCQCCKLIGKDTNKEIYKTYKGGIKDSKHTDIESFSYEKCLATTNLSRILHKNHFSTNKNLAHSTLQLYKKMANIHKFMCVCVCVFFFGSSLSSFNLSFPD